MARGTAPSDAAGGGASDSLTAPSPTADSDARIAAAADVDANDDVGGCGGCCLRRSEWPTTGGLLKLRLPPAVFYLCAVWTVLTTAGVIFGWVSMSSIMEAEGAFAGKCEPVTVVNGTATGGAPCSAQQLALNSVYTAASIFSYVAPLFLGMVLDRYGPRTTELLCLSIFTAGPAFAIAAASTGIDELYYPAFVALGTAASSMLIPLYSVSNLFRGWEGLLLAVLNGSFDAASLVFQIFRALYDGGVPFVTVWVAYLCGPLVVTWVIATIVWRDTGFAMLPPLPSKRWTKSGRVRVMGGKSVKLVRFLDAGAGGSDGTAATAASTPTQPAAPAAATAAAGGAAALTSHTGLDETGDDAFGIDDGSDDEGAAANGEPAPAPEQRAGEGGASSSSSSSAAAAAKQVASPLLGSGGSGTGAASTAVRSPGGGRRPSAAAAADGSLPPSLHLTVATATATADSPALAAAMAAVDGSSVRSGRYYIAAAAAAVVAASPAHRARSAPTSPSHAGGGLSGFALDAPPRSPRGPKGAAGGGSDHVVVVTSGGAAAAAAPADATATSSASPGSKGEVDDEEGEEEMSEEAYAAAAAADAAAAAETASAALFDRMMRDGGFDVKRLHAMSFAQQVRTPEFLAFVAFFCGCMLRFNTFIGSVHPQLEALGQSGGAYTKIFGTILPLGFFSQFIIGNVLDRGGTTAGVWSLWGMGVLFSALNLGAPLAGQPATFVAFAFFRGFIFTVMSSYMSRVLGFAHVGKTIGANTLAGGLVSLLQQPLLLWAYEGSTEGVPTSAAPGFARVNGLLLGLNVAMVAFPVWLSLRGWAARRRLGATAAAAAGAGGAAAKGAAAV